MPRSKRTWSAAAVILSAVIWIFAMVHDSAPELAEVSTPSSNVRVREGGEATPRVASRFEASAVVSQSALDANSESEMDRKWKIVEGILESRNDSDPRLDTELRNLTPEFKDKLREKYRSLGRERLNERGTLVFLVGRTPTEKDLKFLQQVALEPICRSLADCQKSAGQTLGDESTETTLVYPQRVAVHMMAQTAASSTDPQLREQARASLLSTAKTASPPISNFAYGAYRK